VRGVRYLKSTHGRTSVEQGIENNPRVEKIQRNWAEAKFSSSIFAHTAQRQVQRIEPGFQEAGSRESDVDVREK
jgi:hypothetical protein